MEGSRQYGLGETEFQRALAVLDKVQEALRLPRWQYLLYQLYNILIAAFVVSGLACILIGVFWIKATGDVPFAAFIISYSVAILAVLGALIAIPLNLPLLIKIRKQKVRLQELGMTEAWVGLVGNQSRRTRWLAKARSGALGVGLVLIVLGIIPLFLGSFVSLTLISGTGLVFVVFYFLQEGKTWLDFVASRFDEVKDLKEKMTNLSRDGAGRVAVPRKLIERFSQMQAAKLLIEQANAIADFKPSEDLFSVLTSRAVLSQKSRLVDGVRLKVEEAIEELMQNPSSAGTRVDGQTGSLLFPIAGTGLEIMYAVDEKEHRLRLQELRGAAEWGRHG